MARKVFFSFHYDVDGWRASQVRNIGALEGNPSASDNEWEQIKRGGDAAIQRWIDSQIEGRSCTIVLIGSETSERKWVRYEIEKSWNEGNGVLGIHIHKLKNRLGLQSLQGSNPFDGFTMSRDGSKLSSHVKAYNPPGGSSTDVYDHISRNMAAWIETAIAIRANY